MLLPQLQSVEDYRKIRTTAHAWDAAIRHICQRHGLPFSEFSLRNVGTHVVFVRQGREVIKLYCPLFPSDYRRERLVMNHVGGRIDVETPEILYEGDLEGWPYLILTFVDGIPLADVWSDLAPLARKQLSQATGELIAQWHDLPLDGLAKLDANWDAFVMSQIACNAGLRLCPGQEEAWDAEIAAYLKGFDRIALSPSRRVLLNSDFTGEHLMVREINGKWKITGLIDFGDSMIGHPEYDFVAPGLDVMIGDGPCQRFMLLAYGYKDHELDDELRSRLMKWTLLHRYIDLPGLSHRPDDIDPPLTPEQLASVFWRF